MGGILNKIQTNLKNGTLISNGSKALYNRVYRYISQSNILILVDSERKRTRSYLNEIPPINNNHIKAANYYLDNRLPLSSRSIVYSLGILEDIAFEEFVKEKFDSKMFLYDPTPTTVRFMDSLPDSDRFHYFPYAVWTENKELKFTTSDSGGSSSAVFDLGSDFFLARAYTMEHLMGLNEHNAIDVWKADIEGAALPILEQMLSSSIFPKQIIVELERPRGEKNEIDDFFKRVSAVRETLRLSGYEEFALPRRRAKYFSLELLFVKSEN